MEFNEQTELKRKTETGSEIQSMWQLLEGRGQGVDGLSKKEKGLMDIDSSVVIMGEGGIRALNGNGKIIQ